LNRISIRGTAMTAAAAVAGSAALLGVSSWADEPEKELAAAESTSIEPRDAAAIQAERDQAALWQQAKVRDIEQQRLAEERREARKRREARERRQERREERREARQERREAREERREAATRADRSERDASVPSGSPREIAAGMLSQFGWGSDQMSCLGPLWEQESSWDPHAQNPSSGAYGIPQALPGSKMESAGSDWESNPATQIEWGLGYIQDRYGSPCGAWEHSQANGWY
jgi:hypothetical protein